MYKEQRNRMSEYVKKWYVTHTLTNLEREPVVCLAVLLRWNLKVSQRFKKCSGVSWCQKSNLIGENKSRGRLFSFVVTFLSNAS